MYCDRELCEWHECCEALCFRDGNADFEQAIRAGARRFIKSGATDEPLKVYGLQEKSSHIMEQMFQILVEEQLGVHTEVHGPHGGGISLDALKSVTGCPGTDGDRCGELLNSESHVPALQSFGLHSSPV
jgi:hypothetical protein